MRAEGEVTDFAGLPPRPPRLARGELPTALSVTLVTAALGAVVGLIWSAISPHVEIVITRAGPDLVSYESDAFFAAEGSFCFIGLATGVLVGVGGWLIRRYRGPLLLGALVIGSLLGSYVAWQVGRAVGLAHYHQLLHSSQVGRRFAKPVDLRGHGVLYAQAGAAALTYLVAALWCPRADLRRGDRPGQVDEPAGQPGAAAD